MAEKFITIESVHLKGYILRLVSRNGRYYLYTENTNVKTRRLRKITSLYTCNLDLAKDFYYMKKFTLQETGRIDEVFETSLTGYIQTYLDWSKIHSRSEGDLQKPLPFNEDVQGVYRQG